MPFGWDMIPGLNATAAIQKYIFGDKTANVVESKNLGGKFDPNGAGKHGWGKTGSSSSKSSGSGNSDNTSSKNRDNAQQDLGAYGGGSGGGASSNTASKAQLAEYDQGIDQLKKTLGRVPNQLEIALSNIGKQYGIKNNEITSDFGRGKSQYGDQTTTNSQSRRTGVNNVNDSSSSGLRGLLRSLGSMGAVGSDLGLAGRAVQDQATRQRNGVGETFSKNQRGLDTNWGNFQKDIDDERKKLKDWKSSQSDSTKATSKSTKQSLLTQLAQLKSQRATARGKNGADAARADLKSANSLSKKIDNLAKINPKYSGKRVGYDPQSLDSYQLKGSTEVGVDAPNNSTQDPSLYAYDTRDTDEDKRQKNLFL